MGQAEGFEPICWRLAEQQEFDVGPSSRNDGLSAATSVLRFHPFPADLSTHVLVNFRFFLPAS
jgi:hypothetical protein